MFTIIRSVVFNSWFEKLRDLNAKARILSRIDSASLGNFGDSQPVGEGVSEMRVHVGPGYRLYYMRQGSKAYLLLIGGNKSSQRKDIQQAILMARQLKGKES